jgi:hypothetical protein
LRHPVHQSRCPHARAGKPSRIGRGCAEQTDRLEPPVTAPVERGEPQGRRQSIAKFLSTDAVLVQEINRALNEMTREFGPNVFAERRAEVDSVHCHETIGVAWGRCLGTTGFPKTNPERLAVAQRLKLDPSVSLILSVVPRIVIRRSACSN